MLREISQTEKDKYCITYTWTLKMQQTCEYNKKETRLIDAENKLVVGREMGQKQRQQINRHKLLCKM